MNEPRIAAIILAAGRSTRMGAQNKLLADFGGRPMVRVVAEAALASRARPVLVVTGHQAAQVAAALEGRRASQVGQGASRSVPSPLVGEGQGGGESQTLDVVVPPTPSPSPRRAEGAPSARRGGESGRDSGKRSLQGLQGGQADDQPSSLDVTLVPNPDYATGLASSLKAGIRAVPANCDGALILLGDMPGITAEHVDRLIDAFAEAPECIVVPVHEGRQGNPVLWPWRYFPELLQLEGDAGARRLIAVHRDEMREVDPATDAIFADADTPEELARMQEGRRAD